MLRLEEFHSDTNHKTFSLCLHLINVGKIISTLDVVTWAEMNVQLCKLVVGIKGAQEF